MFQMIDHKDCLVIFLGIISCPFCICSFVVCRDVPAGRPNDHSSGRPDGNSAGRPNYHSAGHPIFVLLDRLPPFPTPPVPTDINRWI